MLQIHAAHRAEPLAGLLAEVLAHAPADPLDPEWIAVPTAGVGRWLSLELARHLGAASTASGDGVAANLTYAFPSSLRSQVLDAARAPDEPDHWAVPRLVWSVLHVLGTHEADARLGPIAAVPPGGSRYARARRIADLFDRYHLHRPAMVRAWAGASGEETGKAPADVDGTGGPLLERHRWQPHLWRAVRATIGQPSPPELMPGLLARVADGSVDLGLPERLCLFGFSVLPGGAGFVELAAAVARQREVHLFLVDPSPATTDRVRACARSSPPAPGRLRRRADDHTAEEVHHPLLRSWARLPRETAVLLGDAETAGAMSALHRLSGDGGVGDGGDGDGDGTLLGRIQHDLRFGRAPQPTHHLDPHDRSLQLHAAHGPLRQVEVARDALLHLLAGDPTLREDDVLVVCPDLERFLPLIEVGFGPSSDRPSLPGERGGPIDVDHPPSLRYRVSDRSLGAGNPMVTALTALIDAAVGRFTAPAVLDLLALPALRRRFDLTDDDLSRVTDWVRQTNIRWGLDGSTCAAFGVPASVTANTWGAALDRLLLGAAIAGDGAFAIGAVVPHEIEGDDVALAGRMAEVMARLRILTEAGQQPRPLLYWVDLLRATAGTLLAPEPDELWQAEAIDRVLGELVDDVGPQGSGAEGMPATADPFLLTATDVRRLLADRLTDAPARPEFLRGGITITSANSLRNVPFRVVCLLGLDQAAFSTGATDGDDLIAAQQVVGDNEPRSEGRQGVLDAILSAGEHLVVVRDGHDLHTNQVIPRSVMVAELHDLIAATLAPGERLAPHRTGTAHEADDAIELRHPRQAFDERCLTASALVGAEPWSFDPQALAGALARRQRERGLPPFLAAPLPEVSTTTVELAELHAVLQHPVKVFLRERLQLRIPEEDEALPTRLPVDLEPLEQWHVGTRLLDALLAGGSLEHRAQVEEAIGAIPPGTIGERKLVDLTKLVRELADDADQLGLRSGRPDPISIDVELPDGTRIVGTVAGRLRGHEAGPLRITYSKTKPKYHLAAWLDLLALVATDPERSWRSVTVNKKDGPDGGRHDFVIAGNTVEARRANAVAGLEVIVDLLKRARREPLPLFATLSPALHSGSHTSKSWEGAPYGNDKTDRYNAIAFGEPSYHEILALAASPTDPPGSGKRAQRYATYLWSAVRSTVIDRCPDGKLPDIDHAVMGGQRA